MFTISFNFFADFKMLSEEIEDVRDIVGAKSPAISEMTYSDNAESPIPRLKSHQMLMKE